MMLLLLPCDCQNTREKERERVGTEERELLDVARPHQGVERRDDVAHHRLTCSNDEAHEKS